MQVKRHVARNQQNQIPIRLGSSSYPSMLDQNVRMNGFHKHHRHAYGSAGLEGACSRLTSAVPASADEYASAPQDRKRMVKRFIAAALSRSPDVMLELMLADESRELEL
jgi:hypothetical protein